MPAVTTVDAERVGLLGGSFNPAHEGHLYISHQALKRLRLDRVWWLVSPQNPLKSRHDMAPFDERLKTAREVVSGHPRIIATDIEARLGSVYTARTVRLLARRFPRARFVWLMGADNLKQICQWRDWQSIFTTVPVAVFDRSPYAFSALASRAAHRFAAKRVKETRAGALADLPPPAWTYLAIRPHAASATQLRARHDADRLNGSKHVGRLSADRVGERR